MKDKYRGIVYLNFKWSVINEYIKEIKYEW